LAIKHEYIAEAEFLCGFHNRNLKRVRENFNPRA